MDNGDANKNNKSINKTNGGKYKPPLMGTYQRKVFPEPCSTQDASTQTYKRDYVRNEKYGKYEFWHRQHANRDGSWRK
ncbi:unnamed protein product [Danaus chrysippus]|uniref:(African queen) hypothetical protein n=1 Tax=Danaus chrysippus TaxID=151541 RepID=A0A8J2W3E1_9NEOP|nr:unnamed protein product [Danaus chrysippus]